MTKTVKKIITLEYEQVNKAYNKFIYITYDFERYFLVMYE